MNYFCKRAAYYTFYISELTSKNISEVYELIKKVFLLDDNQHFSNLINNENLNNYKLSSLNIYLKYLNSFCQDESAFGNRNDEFELLEIKKEVLIAVLQLKELNGSDALLSLSTNFQKLKLNVLFCLTAFVIDDKQKNISILKSADTNELLDSKIVQMYFSPNKSQEIYNSINNNNVVKLLPEVKKELQKHYKLESNYKKQNSLWGEN